MYLLEIYSDFIFNKIVDQLGKLLQAVAKVYVGLTAYTYCDKTNPTNNLLDYRFLDFVKHVCQSKRELE